MAPDYTWPDPEDRARDLAPLAMELVHRIRYEDPTALCQELLPRLDGWELWAVITLLAAAVDPHAHPEVLWGWARHLLPARQLRARVEVERIRGEVEQPWAEPAAAGVA